MNKLFSLITLLALLVSMQLNGATASNRFGDDGSDDLVDGLVGENAEIQSVEFTNHSGAAITVGVYNAPESATEAADLSYIIASFTAYNNYETNIVENYTNFLGVAQSRTNTVRYWIEQTYGPFTNDYTKLTTLSVPAGSTVTWTPVVKPINDIGTAIEISATNITATVTYNPR